MPSAQGKEMKQASAESQQNVISNDGCRQQDSDHIWPMTERVKKLLGEKIRHLQIFDCQKWSPSSAQDPPPFGFVEVMRKLFWNLGN
jgi:hypothetical protein